MSQPDTEIQDTNDTSVDTTENADESFQQDEDYDNVEASDEDEVQQDDQYEDDDEQQDNYEDDENTDLNNTQNTDEMNTTLDDAYPLDDDDMMERGPRGVSAELDDSLQYEQIDIRSSIDIDQPHEEEDDEGDFGDLTTSPSNAHHSSSRPNLNLNAINTAAEQPEEEYMSEEEHLRQRYLKVYKMAREKNHQLQLQKQQVEDRLAHYFKTSKKPQEFKEKTLSSNAEERYKKFVETHREKRIELSRTRKKNAAQIRELLTKLQHKQSAASKLQTSYREYKMGAAEKAENSRTGKPIPNVKIEELTLQEVKKDEEVRAIRTKFIYLSNQKDALEKSIKQKEFSDGLHLIDFEQFKMENATLNEKIEEKNESLQKSRLKARSTVHILTHVNEKLQFVQTEDIEMKQRLADLEKELSANKKLLASLKDTRDHYKNQNTRMRDSNPLIGNDQLLVDYESRKQELEDLRYKLKQLRNLHEENERKTERAKRQFNTLVSHQETQGRFLPNIHATQRVGL